ncbi:MAG: hypothetical protein FJW20_16905 [Acidimicrobiia bacterium]|nr:hypothetical protein [Acidimicrobiia bacterium]
METALSRLPVVELAQFYSRFREFENSSAGRRLQELGAACNPPPRAVAIDPWFHLKPGIPIATGAAAEFDAADCIAGPLEPLRNLARNGRLPLRHSVIVFTGIGRLAARPADRDLLWRAFEVPLYQQLRGFQGELLAAECERHQGLHILPDAVVELRGEELLLTSLRNFRHPVLRLASGLTGRIDHEPCACGRKSPRIVGLKNKPSVTILGNETARSG